MSYKTWGDQQPNNRNGSEHCLAALKYFDYKWSDEFCNWDHLQYVCEKQYVTLTLTFAIFIAHSANDKLMILRDSQKSRPTD